jgi:hypothetical protein
VFGGFAFPFLLFPPAAGRARREALQSQMTNDAIPKEIRNPKRADITLNAGFIFLVFVIGFLHALTRRDNNTGTTSFRHSDFGLLSSLGISSFVILPSPPSSCSCPPHILS